MFNQPVVNIGVSAEEMSKKLSELARNLQWIDTKDTDTDNMLVPYMEVIELKKNDVIVITIDTDEIDMDDIPTVIKTYQSFFPKNKVLVQLYPMMKCIDIIRPTNEEQEEYPF